MDLVDMTPGRWFKTLYWTIKLLNPRAIAA